MARPRMHPVQERLWMNQQRMQEVHRRRLYRGPSSHHALVVSLYYLRVMLHVTLCVSKGNIFKRILFYSPGPCNAHMHSSTQHTCGGGNSSPSIARCNGTDNAAYTETYLSPHILPPPQQPTVYSHPEARGPPNFGSPCPVLPILVI